MPADPRVRSQHARPCARARDPRKFAPSQGNKPCERREASREKGCGIGQWDLERGVTSSLKKSVAYRAESEEAEPLPCAVELWQQLSLPKELAL